MVLRLRKNRAFSLIELVVVLVIIGVIAAIAIPRMSRGANNAGGVALRGDLQVLRSSIELYRAEHEGRLPTLANFSDQMTMYTKIDGTDPNVAFDAASGRIYGPYLTEVPTLPIGINKGLSAVEASQSVTSGWVYTASSGKIISGSPGAETDDTGTAFNTY